MDLSFEGVYPEYAEMIDVMLNIRKKQKYNEVIKYDSKNKNKRRNISEIGNSK